MGPLEPNTQCAITYTFVIVDSPELSPELLSVIAHGLRFPSSFTSITNVRSECRASDAVWGLPARAAPARSTQRSALGPHGPWSVGGMVEARTERHWSANLEGDTRSLCVVARTTCGPMAITEYLSSLSLRKPGE